MSISYSSDLGRLEVALGYVFKDQELLVEALTHPSFSAHSERPDFNYQRLEFLGDAVLSLIIGERLYELYPEAREGVLAQYHSMLVKGAFLAKLGKDLGIAEFIRMSAVEIGQKGQGRASTLEDVVESIIGAVYRDSSWETVHEIVQQWMGDLEAHIESRIGLDNPKGDLQERLYVLWQREAVIEYMVRETSGPDHCKQFFVDVHIDGALYGSGEGPSKKKAEEAAALEALRKLSS